MFLSWCKFAALFLSDFRPVHPGSDYADLSCWLRWHMRRTWTGVDIIQVLDHSSLKLLPLKRIVCPCRYCMVKNTRNSLGFYIFCLSIHFSHWNGITADKELYWKIVEPGIFTLVLETRPNVFSHVTCQDREMPLQYLPDISAHTPF